MSPRLLPALALLCLPALVPSARAAIRPFVVAGVATTRSEKTDLNDMLDEYTIHANSGSWEAGGGLRFIPGTTGDATAKSTDAPPHSESPIEIRMRLTFGGGRLHDVNVSGWRSDYSYRHRFQFSSNEQFTYKSWAVGSFFSATLHQYFGFYVGPVLESVKYHADRAWTGLTDCDGCGPAKDEATSHYGTLEAGAHYTVRPYPVRLEGYWAPRRVTLSTTHIVRAVNYKANFSSFKGSLGARVSWEF
jgi:hypothetical protein